MVGSIWLEGIVSQKSQADERDAMETATTVATEAVVSIRTVQSLGKIVIKVKTLLFSAETFVFASHHIMNKFLM